VRSRRPGAVHSHPGGRRGVRFAPVRSVIVSARLAAVAAAAVLALSACGGGDPEEPGGTLPPVTPTPSASATAAEVPPAAQEATPEGAAEFVRFYYQRLELAYAELDPDLLLEITDPTCAGCAALADSVKSVRDEGGRVAPYKVDVIEVAAPPLEPGAAMLSVVATLNLGEFVRFDASGAETFRDAPAQGLLQVLDLKRTPEGWRVVGVTTQ
jgi:hypothetical protein